jgi:hypothetical protein
MKVHALQGSVGRGGGLVPKGMGVICLWAGWQGRRKYCEADPVNSAFPPREFGVALEHLRYDHPALQL